jgi:hypothetical protein
VPEKLRRLLQRPLLFRSLLRASIQVGLAKGVSTRRVHRVADELPTSGALELPELFRRHGQLDATAERITQ